MFFPIDGVEGTVARLNDFSSVMCILAALPVVSYFNIKRKYQKTPIVKETLTYTFDPTDILIKGETFESRVKWNLFNKLRVKKGWIMLYQNMNYANFIPRKAFASEEDFNTFLLYAANNGLNLKGKIK